MSDVPGLRKAAVLMVQLGKERSARVLAKMRESEVEAITAEIAQLDSIDPSLADRVVAEFQEMALAHRYYNRGGLAFAREILEASLGVEKARSIIERLQATLTEMPFQFLRQVDARQIVNFLQEEHPQTIALVISHMGPEQAATVMSGFAPELQAEVAHRIAIMSRVSPAIVRLVESVFEKKLATLLTQAGESTAVGGLQPLVDIINRSDRATEKLILEALEERDRELAEQVRAQMFMFEDIVTLDDRAVQRVLRDVEANVLATALKGVREEVREKIFRNMSERAGENLKEEISLLGPVRLKAVEEAQAKIIHTIRQLEEAGEIVIHRGSDDEFIE
ncbi:MAG: flagellar motor switch protein FliG [Acidothermus cellulolyticus]|nr:flagellar motor switch protein FliG [Acidothermus cellulolyticus]MCL6550432.1 flagellar motor switch protein FliG [Acidothermus cellulolyticus]